MLINHYKTFFEPISIIYDEFKNKSCLTFKNQWLFQRLNKKFNQCCIDIF